MDFRVDPKDKYFPRMSLLMEQQNTASTSLQSICQDFFDESSSVVQTFPV